MSLSKEIFIEEYDKIIADLEEAGLPVDEDYVGDLAHNRMQERFWSMCDDAKDRAKYGRE